MRRELRACKSSKARQSSALVGRQIPGEFVLPSHWYLLKKPLERKGAGIERTLDIIRFQRTATAIESDIDVGVVFSDVHPVLRT